MAKKTTSTSKKPAVEPDADAATPTKQTKARNSTVPPKSRTSATPSATTTDVTDDMIAEHAYHLWKNGTPGNELEHWTAAERALRNRGK